MKKRFYFFTLLFIVLAWVVLIELRSTFRSGPIIGTQAPDFTLSTPDKHSLALHDLRGKVVLLNFWATWCGPCHYEMPSLESFYQHYKQQNFVVLGVSVDEGSSAEIKKYLKENSLTFPVVQDADGKISELYDVYHIPETYLIDAQGKIVDKFVGPQDYSQAVFFEKVDRALHR